MNTNDLYLEYARVIQMCNGTELEDTPWVCVKNNGKSANNHPCFSFDYDTYSFAVAVLEGKPVFENAIVYRKVDGFKVLVEGIIHNTNDRWLIKLDFDNSAALWTSNQFAQCFTWTPTTPKRTFTLNGAELPCPDPELEPFVDGYTMGIEINGYGESFAFASHNDAEEVFNHLKNLLTEARDK